MGNHLVEVAMELLDAGTDLSQTIPETGASYLHMAAQMGLERALSALPHAPVGLMYVNTPGWLMYVYQAKRFRQTALLDSTPLTCH
eukprot:scaffold139003_cov17-Prasinocladus_malaysianus.AAC.1